jgi:hypothetical protein
MVTGQDRRAPHYPRPSAADVRKSADTASQQHRLHGRADRGVDRAGTVTLTATDEVLVEAIMNTEH